MIDLSGLKVLSPLQKESERNSKMVILPRESKFSHQDLYSKSSLMCSILELVRTAFPAAGGEPHE